MTFFCKMPPLIFCYLMGLSLLSCHPMGSTPIKPVKQFPNVDSRLYAYFESFEEEAATRGRHFDLAALNIKGTIEKIDLEIEAVGTCNWHSNPKHVELDTQFWLSANHSSKELIVFHELGHCVLNRSHLDDSRNGTCISIMRTGRGNCLMTYNAANRSEYLDELFRTLD